MPKQTLGSEFGAELGQPHFKIIFFRVRKKGSFGKGVFSVKSIFLEILENLEIPEILENAQTVENKEESDHFLEILENLEILEILEILLAKRPLS